MSLLTAFPSLVIPLIVYGVAAMIGGSGEGFLATLTSELVGLQLPSGAVWRISLGDAFIALGLVFLFLDLLKATGTGTATIFNHALSTAVFIIGLVLFLLVEPFGSSVFCALLVMALLDVVAGFTITIAGARRDFST